MSINRVHLSHGIPSGYHAEVSVPAFQSGDGRLWRQGETEDDALHNLALEIDDAIKDLMSLADEVRKRKVHG